MFVYVTEQHYNFCASLVAFSWAPALICIIGFSRLWSSFDLPPSLMTVRGRVPPPSSCLLLLAFIHHAHFFPYPSVHHGPWCPASLLTHVVVLSCSCRCFNLLPFVGFHLTSWCTCHIKNLLAIWVLNSLSGFLLSNKHWINLFSFVPKGSYSTDTPHSLWAAQGCYLSGETSLGKSFSPHKSSDYRHIRQLLHRSWEDDVISLPNDQPLGSPSHFLIWKLISLQKGSDTQKLPSCPESSNQRFDDRVSCLHDKAVIWFCNLQTA